MIFLPDELSEAFFGGAPEAAAELLDLFFVVRAGILNARTSIYGRLFRQCAILGMSLDSMNHESCDKSHSKPDFGPRIRDGSSLDHVIDTSLLPSY